MNKGSIFENDGVKCEDDNNRLKGLHTGGMCAWVTNTINAQTCEVEIRIRRGNLTGTRMEIWFVDEWSLWKVGELRKWF